MSTAAISRKSRNSSRSDLSSSCSVGSIADSVGSGAVVVSLSDPSLGEGGNSSIHSNSTRGTGRRGEDHQQKNHHSSTRKQKIRQKSSFSSAGGGTGATSSDVPSKAKSFSFKNVRKSFGGAAASFGGFSACNSRPKMRFSKLNTPELEALSFIPTSSSSVASTATAGRTSSSTTRGGAKRRPDNNNNLKDQQQPQEQEQADPSLRHPIPYHTCALIAGLTAYFIAKLPSLENLDEVANIQTFTNVVFDGIMPLGLVVICRLMLATIMLGNAASVFLYGSWYADTDYFPGSRLRVAKRIPFKGALVADGGSLMGGIKCISTFTLWCWIIEGSAFLLAGMIPLFHFLPDTGEINPWIMRLAIVLWEIGAPTSILVSAVVKYALWPMAMEHGDNVKLLKAPGALLQHNLNSIAALLEVGLLGGLPVRLGDYSFPPLYGICYLLYSYMMMYKWTDDPDKNGPQFFYPFFDTTLGITTSLCLVALLAILSMSFAIFVAAEHVLLEAEKFIAVVPLAAIVLLSMMVCRVKD